jgi:hypothetical protein
MRLTAFTDYTLRGRYPPAALVAPPDETRSLPHHRSVS